MKALTALALGMGKKPAAPLSSPQASPQNGAPSGSRLTPIPSPPPSGDPQCDVLFELFNGSLGSVHFGRLLKGHDAGRLVTLRRLQQKPSAALAQAVDLARSIAHPKLAKVLGLVSEGDTTYLASEQISGITLFELGRAACNRQSPVEPSVAVRIVFDTLVAASAAQQLLEGTAGARAARCIFPECTWIADYGETFLSEVFVAPLLGRASSTTGMSTTATSTAAADVQAAALELVRMACAGLSPDDPLSTDLSSLPDELQDVLVRALGPGSLVGYRSLDEFADALAEMDESLVATEGQVAHEVQRLMGNLLTVRRQKLDMLERNSASHEIEDQGDETKFFRLALKVEQRATARPPSDEAAASERKISAAVVDAEPEPFTESVIPIRLSSVPPPDEPTLLFRRQDDGSARADWFGAANPLQSAIDPIDVESMVRSRAPLPDSPLPAPKTGRYVLLGLLALVVIAVLGAVLTGHLSLHAVIGR